MKDLQKILIIEQIDKKLSGFKSFDNADFPHKGWINTIRSAINMSLEQLGKRIGTTKQGAKKVEEREVDGSITIKALKEAANALDMDFVYGFKPRKGSIHKMIEERAHKKAIEIVMRTSQSMALENQKNTDDRIKQAIKSKTEEIKFNLPKYLWD